MRHILIATGGTGGHIFPALALARFLKSQGNNVLIAGAIHKVRQQLEDEKLSHVIIDSRGLTQRSPVEIIKFLLAMIRAIIHARRVINDFKPGVIIGFGGYGSFPLVAAGLMAGIKTMIHEQNVLPGKANRLLGLFVKKIALTFKESNQYFPQGKTVWTGCPANTQQIHFSKQDWLISYGLDPNKKTILMVGGSQGSQALNKIVIDAMKILTLQHIQCLHMTGVKQFQEINDIYVQSSIAAKAVSFISPIEAAYMASDLVIARAGAATICELAYFQKKTILIPYPYAGAHQMHNAKVLRQALNAVIMPQELLTAQALADNSMDLLGRSAVMEINTIRESFPENPVILLANAVNDLCAH